MQRILVFLLFANQVFFSVSEMQAGSLMKVDNFFAKGFNTQDFFLSRHITPKVKVENTTNLLFSFFTTSCIPCHQEIAFLCKYSDSLDIKKFYLVNICEKKVKICKFMSQFYPDSSLKVLMDPYGIVSKKLKIKTTPSLIIISKDGDMLFQHIGYNPADTTMIIEKLHKYFREQ